MISNIEYPYSQVMENAVMSTFLVDAKAFNTHACDVTPDHFYQSRLRLVYEYMLNNTTNDITVLCERFHKDAGWLSELLEDMSSTTNIEQYISVLSDYMHRRKLIEATSRLMVDIKDMDKSAIDIADAMAMKIFDVRNQDKTKPMHIKEVLPKLMEDIGKSVNGIGLKTGLSDIDSVFGGFCNGELIIIAGRPSMGKSAFAINNVASHIAIKQKKPILIFSLEMNNKMTAGRILCSESKANYSKALMGHKADLMKISTSIGDVADAPIYIDETPGITLPKIIMKSKAMHKQYKIGAIVIDHLGLMGVTNPNEGRHLQLSIITKGLKVLARSLDVPVILLSQLSRGVESRNPPEPMMSDLRESGAIEEDADAVMMLYRPEYYFRDKPELRGVAYVIVAKQRNGQSGRIEVVWNGEHMQFHDKAINSF